MVNPLPWGKRVPLLLVVPVFVLPLLVGRQRSSVPFSPSRARQPEFSDWSTRHTLYPRYGTMAALEAAGRDPRAQFRWREQNRQVQPSRIAAAQSHLRSLLMFRFPAPGRLPVPPGRFPNRSSSGVQRDWNISLGSGTTAAGQVPAKFSFDTSATPSCANDFAVFPVNANGTPTQPNLVRFNNLYSGTAGTAGICNRTATANDDGVSATVLWSYAIEGLANGAVPTSPSLSLDGTKVAFVESAAGSAAHSNVLAWKTGDGRVANLQSTVSPKTINT